MSILILLCEALKPYIGFLSILDVEKKNPHMLVDCPISAMSVIETKLKAMKNVQMNFPVSDGLSMP